MPAGLEKTALTASWGAAMPTPPIDLEIGPMPINWTPFVAKAAGDRVATRATTANTVNSFRINHSFLCFHHIHQFNLPTLNDLSHPLYSFVIPLTRIFHE
jgi:hypothetical protein